jgi:hypothetical protein
MLGNRKIASLAVFTPTPADPSAPAASVFSRLAARRDPRQTAGRRDRSDPSYDVLTPPATGPRA